MNGWAVLAFLLALWAAFRLGRWTKAYSQYARGYIEGYKASEHVEAQRDAAARGLQ